MAACGLPDHLLVRHRARDDGLFLRFGSLDPASLRAGTAALVAAAGETRG